MTATDHATEPAEPAEPEVTAASLAGDLEAARIAAARAYDRASALADLRLRLLEAGSRQGRAVTLPELLDAASRRGERERAAITSLCLRATTD